MARADRKKLGIGTAAAETQEELTPPQQRAALYKQCFSTQAGEAVLEDLKKSFGDRRSFVPDSNSTAFHEGQRDVYRMIVQFMERDENRPERERENDES